MAEALAVVSVIASIAQLVDLSFRIVERLKDFQSKAGDLPECFKHISVELPVLIHTLNKTKEDIEAKHVKDATRQAILPAIEGCITEIKSLDIILNKALPGPGDSKIRRSGKAVLSTLRYDSKVEKITRTIRNYVGTLTYYHAASSGSHAPLPGMCRKTLD
jgi:hypothetical protein